MLASLLEKPYNKVMLDRVLVNKNSEYRLAVAPKEKSVYNPLDEVQEEWYDPAVSLVDVEKWQRVKLLVDVVIAK
ncbi:1094_t:CDS:2 [Gigaspora margarita]|uniref:1094_t:CDS:1 n=1 Tax=Gigaspora margarita TaxID=4874 RepID=A0ABN7WA16_GIGMA|nr:1094_t:CDS:2 [Gigaspora margarita]